LPQKRFDFLDDSLDLLILKPMLGVALIGENVENNCPQGSIFRIHQGAFVANTPVPSGYELVPWRQS